MQRVGPDGAHVRIMLQLGADPDPGLGRVEEAVAPYTLEPLHPGSTDASLASWFSVNVPDPAEAERLVSHLRALDGVDAVYVEPMSAPPG